MHYAVLEAEPLQKVGAVSADRREALAFRGRPAVVSLPPSPEAGPLDLVVGEGLPYAPAQFHGPSHRVEPRLKIVGQVIPRLFAYNVQGISFRAFLVENIIRRDAFFFRLGANPLGVFGGEEPATDFVSRHLK